MKKIKRHGLFCTKHNQPCEDAHILSNTFKYCEGGVRCDCQKCQYAAAITEDGTRAIKETSDGFEVTHIARDENKHLRAEEKTHERS